MERRGSLEEKYEEDGEEDAVGDGRGQRRESRATKTRPPHGAGSRRPSSIRGRGTARKEAENGAKADRLCRAVALLLPGGGDEEERGRREIGGR